MMLKGLSVAAALLFVLSDVAGAQDDAARATALQAHNEALRQRAELAFSAFVVITNSKLMYTVTDPMVIPGKQASANPLVPVYRPIYFAAKFTEGLSEGVCTEKETKFLCGAPFKPTWAVQPFYADPTLDSLETWASETEAVLNPLWIGLCPLANAKTGKQLSCAID